MHGVWQEGLRVGAVGYEGHGTIGPSILMDGQMYHVTARHIFPEHMHESLGGNTMDYCCIPSNSLTKLTSVDLWDGDLYDPARKLGAATGHTTGYIDHVRGSLAKVMSHTAFAEPGDSGAAVLTVRSGQLVGILVGGTKSYWDVLLASEIQANNPQTTLKWFLQNPKLYQI